MRSRRWENIAQGKRGSRATKFILWAIPISTDSHCWSVCKFAMCFHFFRDHRLEIIDQSKSFCYCICLIWAYASSVCVNYRSYWWGSIWNVQTWCVTHGNDSIVWRAIPCFSTILLQWNKSLQRPSIMQSKIGWFSLFLIELDNAIFALFANNNF